VSVAPLVNIEKLAEQIREETSAQYVAELVERLPELITSCAHASLRQARSCTHQLSMVLQYHSAPKVVFSALTKLLKMWITELSSNSVRLDEVPVDRSRRIDCGLALAFDVFPCRELDVEQFDLESALAWCCASGLPLPILFNSMRRSYAKALDLLAFYPILNELLVSSGSDEARALQIIQCVRTADQSEAAVKRLLALLLELTPHQVKLVAKDLRRACVPQISKRRQISARQLEQLCYGDDATLVFSRLAILNYAGFLDTHGLNALYSYFTPQDNNHDCLKDKLSILAAQHGFDSVFMAEVNQTLVNEGANSVLLALGRYQDIRDYFEGCLAFWAQEQPIGVKPLPNAPKVSVLFSAHNPDLRLLQSAVRSVAMQTYPNLELVFVDDCSDSVHASEIERCVRRECFLARRPLIYRRNCENQGQYNNRNLGVELATGEYIAIQDDDDISHPDRIALQIARMLDDPQVVASRVKHLRVSGSARVMLDGDEPDQPYGDAPPSFIWHRSVFDTMGLFLPTSTRGDIEFYQRLIRHFGHQAVLFIPAPLLIMRGSFETVSASKEYRHKVALEALRFMYNKGHIAEAMKQGVKPDAWVPHIFKVKARSSNV